MTTVLKLGGSVITAKDDPETVDEGALDRVVRDVAAADTSDGLVVVHGGGSFGHHHADRVGVSTTDGTREADGILAIHDAMRTLNAAVVDRLNGAGVPAMPVHPFSIAARNGDGELSLPVDSVTAMLSESFVPVLHGDAVTHEGKGATILSGDELVVELARTLEAERVGLCSAVPGVLDEQGEVIDRIDTFEAVASALGESEATDVTGGMAAKVQTLLELPVPAHIFDGGSVSAFLDGDSPGTVVDGSPEGG
jgi:isopentenyl phosphate kinase